MHAEKQGDASKGGTSANSTTRRRNIVIALLLGLIFSAAGLYYVLRPTPEAPFDDFLTLINKQGYTPNIGMSSHYRPGTLIRTTATDPDGTERAIDPPLIFAWTDDCFPDLQIRESPFVLPETKASSRMSLTLGMETITTLLPALNLRSAALSNYRIHIENPHLLSIAETDVAHRFSTGCVENIKDALRNGKKLEWFAVIMRVITADTFTLEIEWHEGASAEGRLAVKSIAKQALAKAASEGREGIDTPPINATVGIASEDRQKTIFSGKGNLILGYDAHILKAVLADQ